LKDGEKIATFFSFNRRLGGSHIQSGRNGEEQKELALPTTQSTSLGYPAHGLVTTVKYGINIMPLLTPWNTVIILKPTVVGPGNFGLLWNPDIYEH